MADLFGLSPQMTEQALLAEQEKQALAQANMTPGQMALTIGLPAAKRIGGMLGGRVDPRLEESMLGEKIKNEALQEAQDMGIDPSQDFLGYGKLVAKKFLQYGRQNEAFQVMQSLQGMAKTQAETAKAMRETDPVEKLLTSGKITPAQYAAYQRGELSLGDLSYYEKPEYIEVGAGGGMKGKAYVQDGKIRGYVGDPYSGITQATNVNLPPPGIPAFEKKQKLRENMLQEVKPYRDTLGEIAKVDMLNSQAGNNAVASKALTTSIASLFSGDQKAQAEIAKFASPGGVYEKAGQALRNLISGTTTQLTREEIADVTRMLKAYNTQKLRSVGLAYSNQAKRENLPAEDSNFITSGLEDVPVAGSEDFTIDLGGRPLKTNPMTVERDLINFAKTNPQMKQQIIELRRKLVEDGVIQP